MRMVIRRMACSSGCSSGRYRAARLLVIRSAAEPLEGAWFCSPNGCESMDPMLCAAGVLPSSRIVAPDSAGVQDYLP